MFEMLAATPKPKDGHQDQQPTQASMRASNPDKIRRNPSTDQRKVRRQMGTKKTATGESSRRTASVYRFTADPNDPKIRGWGTLGLQEMLGFSDSFARSEALVGSGSGSNDGRDYIYVDIEMDEGEASRLYDKHENVGMMRMGSKRTATDQDPFGPPPSSYPKGVLDQDMGEGTDETDPDWEWTDPREFYEDFAHEGSAKTAITIRVEYIESDTVGIGTLNGERIRFSLTPEEAGWWRRVLYSSLPGVWRHLDIEHGDIISTATAGTADQYSLPRYAHEGSNSFAISDLDDIRPLHTRVAAAFLKKG
jgi:hypothetical protein